MKLSKYVFIFRNNSYYVCFNSISGNIIKLGENYCDGINIKYEKLSNKQLNYLASNHFIVKRDDDERKFLESKLHKLATNILYLTIEITTSCNFECGFCYQHNWDKRIKLSMDDVEKLIAVISSSDLSAFQEINIDFIGGEPLLYKKLVVDIYHAFKEFCLASEIKLSVKLNTNGFFLNADTLREFNNTYIMLPFLDPHDYGSIVNFKNSKDGSKIYDILCKQICSWVPILNNNADNILIFRYNMNHINANNLPLFFEKINSFGLNNYEINIVNTANSGIFHNNIEDDEFMQYYFEVVLPLCKKYGLKHPIKPRCEISRCKARRKGSFKLYADGRIGLCNGLPYDDTAPHISTLSSLCDVDSFYSEIKSYDYINDNIKCNQCKYIFLCGGPSPCNSHKCPFNLEYLKKYILTLI